MDFGQCIFIIRGAFNKRGIGLETEVRQLAADEMSRDLAKDDDSSIAAKGKGKDKGGKGKDKGSKGKGKDKEGKSSAKQGKGGSSSQNDGASGRTRLACGFGLTMAATVRIAPFPMTKTQA